MRGFFVDRHSVYFQRILQSHVFVHDIQQDALRVPLQGASPSAAATGAKAYHVPLQHLQRRDLPVFFRFLAFLVHYCVVGRTEHASVSSPRGVLGSPCRDGEACLLAQHPILPNGAEASPELAVTRAVLRVKDIPLHDDGGPPLVDLARCYVRLPVAAGNQGTLTVLVVAGAPSARLWLHYGEGFACSIIESAQDCGLYREEVASAQPVGDVRCERLPDYVCRVGHPLPESGRRGRPLGVENRALRGDDSDGAEEPAVGVGVRIYHGHVSLPYSRDCAWVWRVYRSSSLAAPGEVDEELLICHLYFDLDRYWFVGYPVVVDPVLGLEGPLGQLLQLEPGILLPVFEKLVHSVEDGIQSIFVHELPHPPSGHPHRRHLGVHVAQNEVRQPRVVADDVDHVPVRLVFYEELDAGQLQPLLIYLRRVRRPAPKVHSPDLAPVALSHGETEPLTPIEYRHYQCHVVEVGTRIIGNVADEHVPWIDFFLPSLDHLFSGEV